MDPERGQDDDVAMGAQLRALRKAKSLSLQQLSDQCGLSIGLISQIERGLSSPSVKALRSLAEALGVTVGWLFHDGAPPLPEDNGIVLRGGRRRCLSFNDGAVTKELLSPDLNGRIEMLIVSVAPGGESGTAAYSHDGDEGGMVLEGELDLWVDDRLYRLKAGDSFGFASRRPHRFANPGDRPTRVLWAITPPGF